MPSKYQFMEASPFFLHIFEEVCVDPFGCWPIVDAAPAGFFNVVPKRGEQQHERRDSLLTIDKQPACEPAETANIQA